MEGDARETIPTLEGPFDLLFLDATKGEYRDYLELAEPLLAPRALLAVDNVLMSGKVADPAAEGHWSEEQLETQRAFNAALVRGGDWRASVLPVGDGVLVGQPALGGLGRRLRGGRLAAGRHDLGRLLAGALGGSPPPGTATVSFSSVIGSGSRGGCDPLRGVVGHAQHVVGQLAHLLQQPRPLLPDAPVVLVELDHARLGLGHGDLGLALGALEPALGLRARP